MHSRRLLKALKTESKRRKSFINQQQLYGSASHIVATILVLVATMGATLLSWDVARQSTKDAFNKDAERTIAESQQIIGNRLNLYLTVLNGSAGLFESSDFVSRQEWDRYVSALKDAQKYPGVQIFGYAPYLRSNETEFEARVRQNDISNFAVSPKSSNDNPSTPVLYIAPSSDGNNNIYGYNLYSETIRRNALIHARDTGQPALSKKLLIINDRTGSVANSEPGLLLVAPVYDPEMAIQTTEQRQNAITGYVYAVIRVNELLTGIFGDDGNANLALAVYEGTSKNEDAQLFKSANYDTISQQKNDFLKEDIVTVSGNEWLMSYTVSNKILSPAERDASWLALARGAALSLALSLLVYYLLTHRARKFMQAKHQEVQNAKDDLLSLASHQLRTPATVVKQYIGMVLQGYAGRLDDQQRTMLESAYASNERQLHIINQILYVARLDAGQIKLHKERINLNKLITRVTDEHQTSIKENNQKLVLNIPRKIVYLRGDNQYLHMALDNLINNASKYTPSGGKITVTLKKLNNHVEITVADTGVGINKQEISGIFDKFTRGTNSLTSQVNGSGIGLYLVNQIAVLHKGSITVESHKPKGTVFSLILPVRIKPLRNHDGQSV